MTTDFPPHPGASSARTAATHPLPFPCELSRLDGRAGAVALYATTPAESVTAPPLLLVHSVNAAASAHEVAPLFEHFCGTRAVYAPDLPGYGHSDRSARTYTPRLMTDALHTVLESIAREHGSGPVDAIALSLGCEFLARAAAEHPALFRDLTLVSPTGVRGGQRLRGRPGSTRHVAWADGVIRGPGWGAFLFRQLTRPAVIRYFLRRTWGRREIDESLWAYACLTTRQPGAEHAPLSFLSASLFAADIHRVYGRLGVPVLVVHGTRGDFTDYRALATVSAGRGWRVHVMRDAGALPYFERPDEFMTVYRSFLGEIRPR